MGNVDKARAMLKGALEKDKVILFIESHLYFDMYGSVTHCQRGLWRSSPGCPKDGFCYPPAKSLSSG